MHPFLRCLLLLLLLAPSLRARGFDLRRDTFAFSNDTVFAYGLDEAGTLQIQRREKPAEFSHRCFVLARAVMQFRDFAHFAPERPKVSREDYRRLIRRICRIPVWSRGPQEKVIVPGFSDLRGFSLAYEGLLKENLGNWLPTYVRPGNYRMMMGHPRAGQAAAARRLTEAVERRELSAVYLSRFPKMNHVIVIYAARRSANGDLHFIAYDPNYPSQPCTLTYEHAARSFSFEKRWYFPGGRVNVMRVFLSPLH